MRAALFYNSKAGSGTPLERVREMLHQAGHTVVQVIDDAKQLEGIDAGSAEMLVVAGGDGTVAKVMRRVAGTSLPIAVLPMGTANNIAKSTGSTEAPEELVQGWNFRRVRPFDLGLARGPWGEQQFAESLGAGLVSLSIAAAEARPIDDKLPVHPKLAWGLTHFRETLRKMKPQRWTLTIDGEDFSGEYLMLEVLNISSIGPNLALSPAADPSDGLLAVVTAGEAHRPELEAWMAELAQGRQTHLSLPTRQAKQVELTADAELHLDDELHRATQKQPVSIRIQPGALRLLR